MSDHWTDRAACHGMDTNIWFSDSPTFAKIICERCLVRDACLEDAIKTKSVGVWGGTTAYEREGIVRKRNGPAKRREKCPQGHKMTEANTTWRANGTQSCKTCADAYLERRRANAKRPPRTHCRNMHELTPENTYVAPNNARVCRICRLQNQRIRKGLVSA